MAKIKSKGTSLKQEIATVYVAVAQVISMDLPEAESETYEADTLDNATAGIPHEPTGRTEGGSHGFELFYDPVLSGHQSLLALLTTPAAQNWKTVFADAGTSEWAFAGAGFSMGGAVALGDGLKASASIKLNGIPTYPS